MASEAGFFVSCFEKRAARKKKVSTQNQQSLIESEVSPAYGGDTAQQRYVASKTGKLGSIIKARLHSIRCY